MSSRLLRHLTFGSVPSVRALVTKSFGSSALGAPPGPANHANVDFLAAPREFAVFFLHVGAEIEHALMVQYLFSAYSLGGPQLKNSDQIKQAANWRQTIASIAQQEMGHLVAVQNLLQLIGGPLTFDRQDFPATSDLYPFPFGLKPLTRQTLAEYVLAEMPDEVSIKELGLTEKIEEVKAAAGGDMGPTKVNRVGVVYSALAEMFTASPQGKEPVDKEPAYIAAADIQSSSLNYQARFSEWGLGNHGILALTASTRNEALDVIARISDQGEGAKVSDLKSSHFGRFLEIFEAFPAHGEWVPARNVAENPSTSVGDAGVNLITNHYAFLWAKLANLRYRMSLMFLRHCFDTEAPLSTGQHSPRGLLISWAFGEMYNLRSISDILMSLPLTDEADSPFAGPPFEMPYTLSLANRAADRWRLHRDLLTASQQLVCCLLGYKREEHKVYLEALAAANQRALAQVEPIIGA